MDSKNLNLSQMSANVQNFTHDNTNSNGNLFLEISMTVIFVSIIIVSCLILLG